MFSPESSSYTKSYISHNASNIIFLSDWSFCLSTQPVKADGLTKCLLTSVNEGGSSRPAPYLKCHEITFKIHLTCQKTVFTGWEKGFSPDSWSSVVILSYVGCKIWTCSKHMNTVELKAMCEWNDGLCSARVLVKRWATETDVRLVWLVQSAASTHDFNLHPKAKTQSNKINFTVRDVFIISLLPLSEETEASTSLKKI